MGVKAGMVDPAGDSSSYVGLVGYRFLSQGYSALEGGSFWVGGCARVPPCAEEEAR